MPTIVGMNQRHEINYLNRISLLGLLIQIAQRSTTSDCIHHLLGKTIGFGKPDYFT
jgi:hypothetical protein